MKRKPGYKDKKQDEVGTSVLSRQMESVRDHKFHSGYAHSSMDRGTLFRTCIKLKSKQRETVVDLSLCAFRKCVQK